MSFIEEIREMANDKTNKENIVIEDIVKYFKEKMETDTFKDNLKARIKDAINKGKTSCELRIEFWEYCSGCSNTYISVSGCKRFELEYDVDDYDSHFCYKGINLKQIHKRLCGTLSDIYKEKLRELGLFIKGSRRRDNEGRFDYYREDIIVSW